MRLELGDDEAAVLRQMIEERITELGPEIHHTQSSEFSESLKQTREVLRRVLERVSAESVGRTELVGSSRRAALRTESA